MGTFLWCSHTKSTPACICPVNVTHLGWCETCQFNAVVKQPKTDWLLEKLYLGPSSHYLWFGNKWSIKTCFSKYLSFNMLLNKKSLCFLVTNTNTNICDVEPFTSPFRASQGFVASVVGRTRQSRETERLPSCWTPGNSESQGHSGTFWRTKPRSNIGLCYYLEPLAGRRSTQISHSNFWD